MCSLGQEPPVECPPPSSLSPSPPPPNWSQIEHINLLPSRPADLRIITRDHTVFLAQRAVLSFASDKLACLAYSHNLGGLTPIHLDEPTCAVRAMLEWIYPHTSMHIEDFDTLDAAFTISKTYDLDAMRRVLRDLLNQPDSLVNMRADPIRAYSLATSHGFIANAREAAQLAVGRVDFRKEWMLDELKERGVSVECAFRLVQYQFAWESALADVLLRLAGDEMGLGEEERKVLACSECVTGVTVWQRAWGERVYLKLICTPFEECDYLFRPGYLTRIWDEGCEQCMVKIMRNQEALDDWLSRVHKVLRRKWEDIYG
ncbi:hypothetical protein FRC07_005448 [Ceratobasidium sp. 392]|nr:hypothetical protein FRC07_005448 [Ceratobasidium sp. 392]